MSYTEDTLVQQTTADYLQHQLGWKSVYAYNHEDFGVPEPAQIQAEPAQMKIRPVQSKRLLCDT